MLKHLKAAESGEALSAQEPLPDIGRCFRMIAGFSKMCLATAMFGKAFRIDSAMRQGEVESLADRP